MVGENMLHVWSPCLVMFSLSLLFFTNGCSSSRTFPLQDEHPHGEETIVAFEGKVHVHAISPTVDSEDPLRGKIRSLRRTIVLDIASRISATSSIQDTSSLSNSKRSGRRGTKKKKPADKSSTTNTLRPGLTRAPNHDMDASSVAYADYPGPRHHSPLNN
ncbi:hypothetical protein Droror1_Dr00003454 [Drosera rotundifolia]